MALQGSLREMSIAHLIRMNCQENRSGRLALDSRGTTGAIFFSDGKVVHATRGSLQGVDAVAELMTWDDGTFVLEADVASGERTITLAWKQLLTEAMKRSAQLPSIKKASESVTSARESTATPTAEPPVATETPGQEKTNGAHAESETLVQAKTEPVQTERDAPIEEKPIQPKEKRVAVRPPPESLSDDAPTSSKVLSFPLALSEMTRDARRLLNLANERGLTMRVFGTIGIHWHCPTPRQWLRAPDGTRNLEIAGWARESDALQKCLRDAGYEPNLRFNIKAGDNRRVYEDISSETRVQLYLDAYDMYHRLEFAKQLANEPMVLNPTWLWLARAQNVDITEDELRELTALALDHDLQKGRSNDKIDADAIAKLCGDDWGWFKTVTTNLGKLQTLAPAWLNAHETATLLQWVEQLTKIIKDAPKSLRWQTRSRFGESTRWYRVPPQPAWQTLRRK